MCSSDLGVYVYGYGVPVSFDGVEVTDNSAGGDGGGLAVQYPPSFSLVDARLVGNDAGGMGGGLFLDDIAARTVAGAVIEAGTANYGGGVYVNGAATPDTWTHVVLAENEARTGGGGVFLETTRTEFENSVILGNAASEDGAALYSYVAPLSLVNTVVGYNAGAPAVYFWSQDDGTRLQYDAWWENTGGDLDGALTDLDDTHVFADPLFADWSDDGDDTDDSFVLGTASALIDAGDPAILDPDGSVSDIGLLGGDLSLADGDSDGTWSWQDCDDDDATVHPGASDTPYDDIDSDCAGDSDWDQDGDGVDAIEGGGTDCDDTDAEVVVCDTGDTAPGDDTAVAADDTGSVPTPAPEDKACGCGGSAAGALFLPLLLLGRRRRA